jgi:hypothetical protein
MWRRPFARPSRRAAWPNGGWPTRAGRNRIPSGEQPQEDAAQICTIEEHGPHARRDVRRKYVGKREGRLGEVSARQCQVYVDCGTAAFAKGCSGIVPSWVAIVAATASTNDRSDPDRELFVIETPSVPRPAIELISSWTSSVMSVSVVSKAVVAGESPTGDGPVVSECPAGDGPVAASESVVSGGLLMRGASEIWVCQ